MDAWQPPTTPAPADGPLIDTFGRVADDLRVSVTDRCNFRCTYCMPAEGLAWLPKEEILTFEEMTRLLGIFVGLGVRSIKVTGGEPTVRADLPTLVRMFREVGPDLDISITTNGVLLDRLAAPLAEAGVDRATVSCDSLMRHRFAEMTRRDALDKVLAGLQGRRGGGAHPDQDQHRGHRRHERRRGRGLRPVGARDRLRGAVHRVHAAGRASTRGSARRWCPRRGSWRRSTRSSRWRRRATARSPPRSYRFADGAPGAIGVIASVTEPFCDTCNRLRITAEGQVRSCLFALEETDLRGPMRAGASDDELAALIRGDVWRKWSGHRINHPDFVQPDRSMSMIGG